jgi:hypothetical protein
VLALATYVGPWGAYASSARSQVARLTAILERNGLLEAGDTPAPARRVPDADAREASAVVRYLTEPHGTARLAALFPAPTAQRLALGQRRARRNDEAHVKAVVTALGVPYVERWERAGAGFHYFTASTSTAGAVPLGGYDLLVRIRPAEDSIVPDTGVTAVLMPEARVVRVKRGAAVLVDVPLDSPLAVARRAPRTAANAIPPERLRATAERAGVRAAVWVRSLTGIDSAGTVRPRRATGDVLVDLRP